MAAITVEVTKPNRPDAVQLIRELDEHLSSLYPVESTHFLDIQTLMQPSIHFVLAFAEGVAVGCGALRLKEDYAEVKRMYVKPTYRGKGVGYKLLNKVETLAREAGYTTLRLETGVYQLEAVKLYERHGFHRRGPFGEYTDDPLSMCYEKRLD